jgi:uncharacterized protein YjiS (DUF1127 family)
MRRRRRHASAGRPPQYDRETIMNMHISPQLVAAYRSRGASPMRPRAGWALPAVQGSSATWQAVLVKAARHGLVRLIEQDRFRLNRSCSRFCLSRMIFFGKAVSTLPDHALTERRIRRGTGELSGLDDRLLTDIGLTRGQIVYASRFGRVPPVLD